MKFLKILVIVVVLVAAGLLLFLPSEMKVKKEITIDAPASVVYEQISDYHNWMKWSAWHKLDSNMKVEYSDQNSGVGAYQKWESEHPQLGVGMMKTVKAENDKYMLQDLYFIDLDNPAFQSWFKLEKTDDNKTLVTWAQADSAGTFDLQMRMIYAFMADQVEEDFTTGLENLKNEAEFQFANAKPYELEIMEKELASEFVLAVMDSTTTNNEDIQNSMKKCYGMLAEACNKNNIATDYTSYSIAHIWDEENDKFVFEAAFAIENKDIKTSDNMRVVELGGGKFIVGMLKGKYDYLYKAHEEIYNYMTEKGIEASGMPFEKYMNSPQDTEPDQLITMVAYPVN